MLPSVLFANWIYNQAKTWKDELAGWMVSWLASGATKTLEDMEPGIIDQVRETIQQIIDNPQTPLATKTMLEKSLQQGNIFHVAMGWILSVIGLIPALFGLGGRWETCLITLRSLLCGRSSSIR